MKLLATVLALVLPLAVTAAPIDGDLVKKAPVADAAPQGYGSYPPPAGGYGSYPPPADGYGSYPPVAAPAAPAGGYGSYPPPAGGYGTYGAYPRKAEEAAKE